MQEKQETWVWFLGWEDHLEEEMATRFSILAWKIPWTVEPGGLQSMGSQRVGHNWETNHARMQVENKQISKILKGISFLPGDQSDTPVSKEVKR